MLCNCVFGVIDSVSEISVLNFVVSIIFVSNRCWLDNKGDIVRCCSEGCISLNSSSIVSFVFSKVLGVVMVCIGQFSCRVVSMVSKVLVVELFDKFNIQGLVSGLCNSICISVFDRVSVLFMVKVVSVCGMCSDSSIVIWLVEVEGCKQLVLLYSIVVDKVSRDSSSKVYSMGR